MTRILLTNDDGYDAPGITALHAALNRESLWDIVLVAPDRERSASGHSLTLHRPLRLDPVESNVFRVDGTPTDCVILANRGGLDASPDLVVSGVNAGWNLGDDVTYSGTVAAAMEGTLAGLPSIAVSLAGDRHFDTAAAVAVEIVKQTIEHGMPEDTFLNVNVPDIPLDELRGTKVTRLARRSYMENIIQKRDPRGRAYYWFGSDGPEWAAEDDCDYAAVAANYASVTPLHLDLTNYEAMSALSKWRFPVNAENS